MKLVLSGVLLALVAAASAKNFGAIKIKGVDQQIYVVGPDWTSDFIVMNGEDGFTLNGGGRIYFANKATDSLDADMYWQTPLMDMHFAYNIDLSNVGCHCNAAGYFIGMPVTEEAARRMPSELTRTCSALSQGAPLTPT